MVNHPNRSRKVTFTKQQIAFLARALKKIGNGFDDEIAARFYVCGLADELEYTNDDFDRADFQMSATREDRWVGLPK